MNDKRCPSCDLLIDESAAKCSCQFVFWDDTPDHVITPGRLLFSAVLLFGAVAIGLKLSDPMWAGQAKISLMALSGFALAFNIMPNVRKHGGYALSLTFIVLAVISYSMGTVWWDMNPPMGEIAPRVYDKNSELSIAELKVGQPFPNDIPNGVQIETDDRGLVIAITGDSVEQGPYNLLKVGDPEERVNKSFPRSQYSGRIHRLNDVSLFITIDEEKVAGISLLEGAASPGASGTLDGFMLGTSESVAKVVAKERTTSIPKMIYSEERPRVIVGLVGQAFESEGNVVKVGQHVDEVPTIYGGYGKPFTTVVYDDNKTVKEVGLGKFDSKRFGPPLLSTKTSEKLEARFLFQKCAEADDQNRPKILAEEWETPIGKLIITGPSTPKDVYEFRKSAYDHSAGSNGERKSNFHIGEKSHWRDVGCKFKQRGEHFDLYLKTQKRSTTDEEKAYLQDFGQAVLDERETK